MKVCFPTMNLEGLESRICEHFGSASGFVIVDSKTRSVEEIGNDDLHHEHEKCQPLKALQGREVDAVAVGGIGMGALTKLQALGIKIYRATEGTVRENIGLILEQKMPEFNAGLTCAGHAGGGCVH